MQEYILEKRDGIALLTFGGGQQGEVDGSCLRAMQRTAAEGDFSEDDGEAQGPFGVIVGWRHVLDGEESEDVRRITIWIGNALTQIFGIGVGKRAFA